MGPSKLPVAAVQYSRRLSRTSGSLFERVGLFVNVLEFGVAVSLRSVIHGLLSRTKSWSSNRLKVGGDEDIQAGQNPLNRIRAGRMNHVMAACFEQNLEGRTRRDARIPCFAPSIG